MKYYEINDETVDEVVVKQNIGREIGMGVITVFYSIITFYLVNYISTLLLLLFVFFFEQSYHLLEFFSYFNPIVLMIGIIFFSYIQFGKMTNSIKAQRRFGIIMVLVYLVFLFL